MPAKSIGSRSDRREQLATRYIDFLLRWRYPIMILVVICSLASILSMKHLVMDNSNEAFFRDGDPAIQAVEKFREHFGNEDSLGIAIKTDGIFTEKNLAILEELADELERKVPYVDRATWIGNVEYLSGRDNEMHIGPLHEERDGNKKELTDFREDALGTKDHINNLVSADGRIAVIILELVMYPEKAADPRKEIAPAIYSVLGEEKFKDLDTAIVGEPVRDYEFDRITAMESLKLGGGCLLVQFFLLLKIGRGIRGVITPNMVTFISLILTLGIISVAGWPLSMMVIMLPSMLFCVCIGDTLHLITDFHRHLDQCQKRRTAIVRAVADVTIPCLLTTITTACGFLSFLATDIVPIRMAGVYSAIGACCAFVLSMVLTPIIMASGGKEKAPLQPGENNLNRRVHAFAMACCRLSLAHPRLVLTIFALLSGGAVICYHNVKVETNIVHDLSTSLKVRQDYDFFDNAMGGAMSLEVILDTGRENQFRNLETLKELEKLQNYIDAHPFTEKTHSIVNMLRRMRFAMHNETEGYETLPTTQQQLTEYLLFYETAGGRNLDKELSLLSDAARIHVQTRTIGTRDVKNFMNDIRSFAASSKSQFTVSFAGQMPWVEALSEYVVHGQVTSLLTAALTITLLMSLFLRSLRLGMLSMIANILPVLLPLGLMGLIGINMSISLMVFSCVILGVAVDDTIYFYTTFREEFTTSGSYRDAALKTIEAVGTPVVFTTVSLMAGFGIFALSKVSTSSQFGYLGAFAFFWALLADLFLSPALMILLKPLPKTEESNAKVFPQVTKSAFNSGARPDNLSSALSERGEKRKKKVSSDTLEK